MTNPFDPPSGETPDGGTPVPPSQNPYGEGMPPYGQSMPPYGYGQPPHGQPPPYAQPQYGHYPMAMRNGLGTAALVLGIIGAVAGVTLFLFFLAFVLGVLAVIFGLVGRGRAKRGEASNKTMATWGLWLGVAALVLSIVGLLFVIHVAKLQHDCRERAVDQQQYDDCRHVW